MRLQKVLTQSGVASRREAEAIIQEGRVTVNNEIIYHPAHEVTSDDKILLDGDPLPKPEKLVYFAYHKPKGMIVDRNDPQHRPSIFKQLKQIPMRVESVDKLDMQTTGLLLLTNDGDLAHKLTSSSSRAPRKFLVKIWKRPDARKMQILKKGVFLDDGKTQPLKLRIIEETESQNIWMEVLVTESRHRLLKRIFEQIGHPVSKIKRISFATISIGKLEPGEVRMLTGEEVRRLKGGKVVTLPVEAAGELPGGFNLEGVVSLQDHLVQQHRESFARSLITRLLGYSLGRRVERSDQEAISVLATEVLQKDLGMRDLINELVLSDPFNTK